MHARVTCISEGKAGERPLHMVPFYFARGTRICSKQWSAREHDAEFGCAHIEYRDHVKYFAHIFYDKEVEDPQSEKDLIIMLQRLYGQFKEAHENQVERAPKRSRERGAQGQAEADKRQSTAAAHVCMLAVPHKGSESSATESLHATAAAQDAANQPCRQGRDGEEVVAESSEGSDMQQEAALDMQQKAAVDELDGC